MTLTNPIKMIQLCRANRPISLRKNDFDATAINICFVTTSNILYTSLSRRFHIPQFSGSHCLSLVNFIQGVPQRMRLVASSWKSLNTIVDMVLLIM